jgi:two-component system KDP operon response regulator KdpE
MAERTLLLIEMEPQVAGAYELFLSGRGYSVTTVSSVAAALRAASSKAPAGVIIGSIPDTLDASTVAERVRAVVSPHPVTILVLSPSLDEIGGADIVIPHWAHPRAVLYALRTAMRRHSVTQPLATVS